MKIKALWPFLFSKKCSKSERKSKSNTSMYQTFMLFYTLRETFVNSTNREMIRFSKFLTIFNFLIDKNLTLRCFTFLLGLFIVVFKILFFKRV